VRIDRLAIENLPQQFSQASSLPSVLFRRGQTDIDDSRDQSGYLRITSSIWHFETGSRMFLVHFSMRVQRGIIANNQRIALRPTCKPEKRFYGAKWITTHAVLRQFMHKTVFVARSDRETSFSSSLTRKAVDRIPGKSGRYSRSLRPMKFP
jgi:hypothetical protein